MAWKAKEESGRRSQRKKQTKTKQVQWDRHTHIRERWESHAQETTADTRMCGVEYTKRLELEGVQEEPGGSVPIMQWELFESRRPGKCDVSAGHPGRRVGGTFSQTHLHVSDGYPT